jgi:hypothetical protein
MRLLPVLNAMPTITDMVEYEFTHKVGQIIEVLNGEGYLGVTKVQRKAIDRLVEQAAKASVKIVTDHL